MSKGGAWRHSSFIFRPTKGIYSKTSWSDKPKVYWRGGYPYLKTKRITAHNYKEEF